MKLVPERVIIFFMVIRKQWILTNTYFFQIFTIFSTHYVKTDVCNFHNGITFQVWYPFEIDDYRWVAAIYDAATLTCSLIFFVYAKAMPPCMIFVIITQLKIFQQKLKQLDVDSAKYREHNISDIDIMRTLLLKRRIKEHTDIIR